MARGAYLRNVLVPLLSEYLTADLDEHSASRFNAMKEKYGLQG